MPTNLPPQYFAAEKRYKQAQTPQEKIEALEDMLAIMPKHKGTDKLRADLRNRIAKAHDEAQRRPVLGRKGSLLYNVVKEGAGQVILAGLPNAGKSQLVSSLTGASPEVAVYPFTTQTPLPAMMKFENIQIQLVDVPAINAPQVDSWLPNILRNTDLLLILVDLTQNPVSQMGDIMERLEKFRIKLPVMKAAGELEERMISKKSVILGNKIDLDGSEDGWQSLQSRYGKGPLTLLRISAVRGDGLEELGKIIYEKLEIMRVYTQAPGRKADLTDPTVVKRGSTVEEVAAYVHKDFLRKLKYAQVWGSGKFDGQKVKRDYILQEGDIIELHT